MNDMMRHGFTYMDPQNVFKFKNCHSFHNVSKQSSETAMTIWTFLQVKTTIELSELYIFFTCNGNAPEMGDIKNGNIMVHP